MNTAGMVAAVRRKVGTNQSDGMLTPEVFLDLVNEANMMLEAERDWPWRVAQVSFSTVSGQQSYDQSAFTGGAGDWMRTVELKPVGQHPLVLRSVHDLDSRNPGSAQGAPWEYAYMGDSLLLSPTPSGVYTIVHRYVRVPPVLNEDADTPLMPATFRWAIVNQAAALAFQRIGSDDRAQLAEQAVDRWRARMLDDQRRSTGPMRVRVRPGSAL